MHLPPVQFVLGGPCLLDYSVYVHVMLCDINLFVPPCLYAYQILFCVDIDECKNGLHQCSAQSTCINTLGSYKCEGAGCPTGYKANGGRCKGESLIASQHIHSV